MKSEHDIRTLALAVARGLITPEAARRAIRTRTDPAPLSQALHLPPTLQAEACDPTRLPAIEREEYLRVLKELWPERRPEEILREDGEFGARLVAQRLAPADAVEEALALQKRLLEAGVKPLPRLGDLLLERGGLSPRPPPEAPMGKAPTQSEQQDMPLEAVEAAKDPRNLLGQYVRTALLGKGGMGDVWKAWDKDLRRWVALKFLKGTDPQEIARFRREAQTAAKLSHPNIGAVYGAAENHIVMQFIEGRTLETFPRDDPRAVVEVMRQAALAVQFAHEQGVLHRDLKPGNIMVVGGKRAPTARRAPGVPGTPQVHAFVMDFGLAKSMNADSKLSFSGMIVGTPSFMSPEQARGERDLDARADVYCLGATLYERLADGPPFVHKNVYDLIRKVIEEEARPLRRCDPDLNTIVMKCLEKVPSRRYGTALELAEDLGRWLAGEAIVAHPPSVG